MPEQRTATRDEWQAAREELLKLEKQHTRRGDELARMRRELPWVRVDKDYRLDTDEGPKALAELFDGRSQLLVYHFMFGPSYEAGCPTCSSMADGVDGLLPHLHARDVTMLFVSRAPLESLQAYKRRMGWRMPWVSSAGSDFNFDFGLLRLLPDPRPCTEGARRGRYVRALGPAARRVREGGVMTAAALHRPAAPRPGWSEEYRLAA